jgi:DNA modification methylase
VAAKKLGRKAVGIEISKNYCDMAIKRIKAVPERLDRWGVLNVANHLSE